MKHTQHNMSMALMGARGSALAAAFDLAALRVGCQTLPKGGT